MFTGKIHEESHGPLDFFTIVGAGEGIMGNWYHSSKKRVDRLPCFVSWAV